MLLRTLKELGKIAKEEDLTSGCIIGVSSNCRVLSNTKLNDKELNLLELSLTTLPKSVPNVEVWVLVLVICLFAIVVFP